MAILTNGSEWRLYTERSTVGAYFAFHLIRNGQFCSLDEFRVFYTFFRAAAFERNAARRCFLDSVREQSLRLQADLEDKLRKRIFGVLEDVGTGFVDFQENRLTEANFVEVYSNALVLLYRLLFVLYAESRGLLPVKSYGPGANRRYLNDFSLARLVERLRDRTLYADNAFTTLYEELLRLFHLINGTHPRQNAALGATRYNGGLFNPELNPKLEDWRIGDRALADVLRQLIFAQPPARASQQQGQLSTDESIDYSTLEVRQLGDIYEGLLGAHFERHNTRLELRNQNGENHRHGIFYTPDWVVQFLIRETLTPQLAHIEQSEDVQRRAFCSFGGRPSRQRVRAWRATVESCRSCDGKRAFPCPRYRVASRKEVPPGLASRRLLRSFVSWSAMPVAIQTIRRANAQHGSQPFIDCENNSPRNSLASAARHFFESLREI